MKITGIDNRTLKKADVQSQNLHLQFLQKPKRKIVLFVFKLYKI